MELICEIPTLSSQRLAVFLKQLRNTADRFITILALADSGSRILTATP